MDENLDTDSRIGELIVAAFDEAAQYSDDPDEISHLATSAVVHILERALRSSPANELEPPAIVKGLPPTARRMAATALRLVPRDGPRVRLRTPSVLRLIPSPATPSKPTEGGSTPASRVLRVVE